MRRLPCSGHFGCVLDDSPLGSNRRITPPPEAGKLSVNAVTITWCVTKTTGSASRGSCSMKARSAFS